MKKFTLNLDKKVKQFSKEIEKSGIYNKIEAYNLVKNCDTKLAKQLKNDINKGVAKVLSELQFTPEQIWLGTERVQKVSKRIAKKDITDVQA